MHFHFVSAHFGSAPPWKHNPKSTKHKISNKYYDDSNSPSRKFAMHPRLKAKIPKMLEWKSYSADWYVWLDSSIKLNPNVDIPSIILKVSDGSPLCLFRHSKGRSIMDEAICVNENIRNGNEYFRQRFDGEPIKNQVVKYYQDSEFKDDNLFQMSFFAYHRSASELMEEWFIHNCLWSIKDQISFPYVLHKSGLNYGIFEGTVINNSMFKWCWKSRENYLTKPKEEII